MNVLDDFLFGKMVTYPQIGERFCRMLISIILDVDLTKVKIVPQKFYYGADSDSHGARLDVYIEEEKQGLTGRLFDIEPDKNDKESLRKALPQRVRLYHVLMDQECLKAGQDYDTIRQVVVIMVTPYDPFGYDRMVYTIKNCCVELPDMPYEDGARTLFLYTRGKKGEPPQKLQELLRYMEESTEENACNGMLKDIHEMVEKVKSDKEVSIEYMKIFEREKMLYENGREEGKEEGKEESSLLYIRNLMESTGWAAERVMDSLKIPHNQRGTFYRELSKNA